MSKKPYGLGIIVGRFQTIHAGHEYMINKALETCETVGIFVGSSQESGTAKNPFTYETRKELLTLLFGDKVKICPLADIGVGNTSKWGDYVLENVVKNFGREPDLFISGKEERRADWLSSEAGLKVAELYVPKTIEISASEMRRFFIEDDKESWMKYTSPALYDKYDALREDVMKSKDVTETKSI